MVTLTASAQSCWVMFSMTQMLSATILRPHSAETWSDLGGFLCVTVMMTLLLTRALRDLVETMDQGLIYDGTCAKLS